MTNNFARRALVVALAGLLLATTPALAQPTPDPFGQPALELRSHPAYYVWVDQTGWHVRWSTNIPQLFSGFVATTDGEIRNLRRAGGGSVSWLSPSASNRASFATVAFSGIDGFDFESTGTTVVFNLLNNTGLTRREWVFIGRHHWHPAGMPFTLVVNPLLVLQGGQQEGRLSEIDRPVDRDR